MATRRVRRIKRAGSKKKQVHRVRKTKHHHKRNHNRITRRHQGGMWKSIFKAIGTTKINPKGGPLYDGIEVYKVDDVYGVGNQTLNEYDSSDEANQRYAHKIRYYLDKAGISSYNSLDQIQLTQTDFDKFKQVFTNITAGFEPLYVPTTFRPRVSGTKAELKLDPKRIVINASGVQFKGTPQSWNNGKCMFDNYTVTTPFAKVDFVISRADSSVRVKFTLPSMDVAYCALAQYGDHAENVYDLLSPSATLVLSPTTDRERSEDNWDVTLPIDTFYTKFRQYFDRCKTGTGFNEHAYKFYEERNPLISTLFFTKPTEVEYPPEVLLTVNNRNLEAATKLIAAQPDNVLSPTEKGTLNALIDNYKKQLLDNRSNNAELNRLDKEITSFVKVDIAQLLLKAQKAAAMSPSSSGMDALAGIMSGLTPMGGVARRQ